MKISVGKQRPAHYRPAYPEEFELFSHLELCSAVPQALFAITTWKENGLPNLCPHAWTCFHGDRTAFFACMGNLYQHTHTYANILREKCFCLNFLALPHYRAMMAAIREKTTYSHIPAALKGPGIAFIITGLMGIAFMIFSGIKL